MSTNIEGILKGLVSRLVHIHNKCHILFKNGEYPYIAQQLMQKLNEARRKFPCPCQVLPDRQEPVSKSMGLDYLCFLYQALMLTALFIIADTNQQYLPSIRLKSLRISFSLDLTDGRVSVFIPLQLQQQGRQAGMVWLGQEDQVGEAFSSGEFPDEGICPLFSLIFSRFNADKVQNKVFDPE